MSETRKAVRQRIRADADKLYSVGRVREAAILLKQCFSLFDDSEKQGTEWAQFCMGYGAALAESGDPKLAETMFHSVVLASPDDLVAQATAYLNLGRVYASTNSLQPAYDHFTAALTMFQKAAHQRGAAHCLLALATLFFGMGAHERAQEFLSQFEHLPPSLRKDPAIRWSYQMQLAQVQEGKQETASAIETLHQALLSAKETGDSGYVAQTESRLGQTREKLGDLPGALEALGKAYDEARAENSPQSVASAWHFASALERTGQVDRALAVYKQSLDQIDLLRTQLDAGERFRIMESHSQIARSATRLLFEKGAYAEAFEVSERGQARATLDLMFERQRKRQGSRPIRAARQGRISLDSPGIAALEEDLAESNVHLLKLFLADYRLFVWFLAPNAPLKAWEATNALESLGEATTGMFKANMPEAFADTPGDAAEVMGLLSPSRPPWGAIEQALQKFWGALLPEDVQRHLLEHSGRLLILPHREIYHLPFAAILQRDQLPVGERWEVATAPSAGAYLQLDPRRDPEVQPALRDDPRGALAVGGICEQTIEVPLVAGFPEPSLKLRFRELSMTEAEANRVVELFGGTALMGPEATAQKVCQAMQEHRLIHFATHGYWSPAGDISLLLVGDSALTSQDLVALPLQAELVVLSACQTGLGMPHPDSYTGLAQNFLIAGARSILMTLWPIADSATLFFMERFYSSLKQGNSPVEALMKAQRAMRENSDLADGYNWAAFQFVGRPYAVSPSQTKFPGPVFAGGSFTQSDAQPGALLDLTRPSIVDP